MRDGDVVLGGDEEEGSDEERWRRIGVSNAFRVSGMELRAARSAGWQTHTSSFTAFRLVFLFRSGFRERRAGQRRSFWLTCEKSFTLVIVFVFGCFFFLR